MYNILSITAQKPSSTGSGVYLTEIVKELSLMGHKQAVVGGVYPDDEIPLPDEVDFYPVYFKSDELPFPICGMSDEMPYESTRYCDMTEEMVEAFSKAFLSVLTPLIEEFKPDLILCHHLYLLTAIVRDAFPDKKIYGFCHNTDLRQMQKTPLKREWIADKIRGLDHILVPQSAQEKGVIDIYNYPIEKITRSGMGYNDSIFFDRNIRVSDGIKRIVFAGKIAEKKGLFSLIRSLEYLDIPKEKLELFFAGGAGNTEECNSIEALANNSKYKITFMGRMPQNELAILYSKCDIFVLPSFYEGIPLTVIEALACGCRVVMTKLPGIPEWINEVSDNTDILYVDLPEIINTDEAVFESLPAFEKRLSKALLESIEKNATRACNVSRISWKGISNLITAI